MAAAGKAPTGTIALVSHPSLRGARTPWASSEYHLCVGILTLQCLFEQRLLPSGMRLREAGMQQSHPQRHKETAQLAQEPAALAGQPTCMGSPCFVLKGAELSSLPFLLNAQIHEPFL